MRYPRRRHLPGDGGALLPGPGACPLPKRNYGFEKRQKDLAKQRKKEEKAQKKLERKTASENPDSELVEDESAGE